MSGRGLPASLHRAPEELDRLRKEADGKASPAADKAVDEQKDLLKRTRELMFQNSGLRPVLAERGLLVDIYRRCIPYTEFKNGVLNVLESWSKERDEYSRDLSNCLNILVLVAL